MSQGKVTVNNLNLSQGGFPGVENKLLFIGAGGLSSQHGTVISVNSQTDFDSLLGSSVSILKRNIVAAQLNAGQNWEAWVLPMPTNATLLDYLNVIDAAMEYALKSNSPEAIVKLSDAASTADITALSDKILSILAKTGRQLFALQSLPGIDAAEQWAGYEAKLTAMVAPIVANRVCVVPQLHGNDVGILAGRLCNRSVTVADSPMRVETGPVLGLGPTPKDKDGKLLSSATLSNLDAARISCIQNYPDYPGTYWGDANMLEAPAGDFQVIEYLRPVLKVARAVRLLAIARIANRRFNETPASIEAHKNYFARPMREMSKSTTIMGIPFPGEIKPPKKDAVEIQWLSKHKVSIFIRVCPYGSPKDITANIILDLSEAG